MKPPFKPNLSSVDSTEYFDPEFAKEDPLNTFVPTANLKELKEHESDFKDFTYAPSNDLLHK